MASPHPHKRSKSDPPPITVEDTATGAEPEPSPSPSRMTGQTFGAYETRQMPPPPNPHLRDRRNNTWDKGHKRRHSPGVEWHEKWTKDSWKHGRVLLIDYVGSEHTTEGRRKIVAQEFQDIDGLRSFYRNQHLSRQAALRVIHVQNASWATRFFIQKFNIDSDDNLIGTSFGRWAKYEKPQRRGGKPVLSGKTFRPQRDPWRAISRSSFGCDYLRHYEKSKFANSDSANSDSGMKMMELNSYDSLDQPHYGYDVFVQRLSVYVQLSDGEPGLPVDPDIRNPYNEEEYREYQRLRNQYGAVDTKGNEQRTPKIQTLDNGSTIIIFEHSQSGSVNDTLIGARQEIEERWRRLTFYLPKGTLEDDERMVRECMDLILRDILKALSFAWEKYLNICETHVGILEDKIYENPADESRAPELWTNSSLWLKVERLMYIHTDIVKEMRHYLKEIVQDDPRPNELWLGSSADELDKLTTQFQEGVVKPTTNLSDLMYKSVGIRDARHSLQLGLSMWRLSWITFIFLPLTFVCGFFGMNVDTFEPNPSIKWWFITTIPLFLVVTLLWYGVKHTLSAQRQNPLRRGVYESLYYDLSKDHPRLWTRRGPRPDVVPVGWWAGVKWGLVSSWFSSDKTITARSYDPGDEELGVISRLKRHLAKRWLNGLHVFNPQAITEPGQGEAETDEKISNNISAVGELLSLATPIALADADPTAASRFRQRLPFDRLRSLSPTRSDGGSARPGSGSGSRTSADGASGVMVEEKAASEDERSGDEAAKEAAVKPTERLRVPLYPGIEGARL